MPLTFSPERTWRIRDWDPYEWDPYPLTLSEDRFERTWTLRGPAAPYPEPGDLFSLEGLIRGREVFLRFELVIINEPRGSWSALLQLIE